MVSFKIAPSVLENGTSWGPSGNNFISDDFFVSNGSSTGYTGTSIDSIASAYDLKSNLKVCELEGSSAPQPYYNKNTSYKSYAQKKKEKEAEVKVEIPKEEVFDTVKKAKKKGSVAAIKKSNTVYNKKPYNKHQQGNTKEAFNTKQNQSYKRSLQNHYGKKRAKSYRARQYNSYYNANKQTYDPSVTVKKSWEELIQFTFSELSKYSIRSNTSNQKPTLLFQYGKLNHYYRRYDTITTKKPVKLLKKKKVISNTTTSEDKYLMDHYRKAQEQLNDSKEPAGSSVHVYATDFILSVLMAAPTSVYPFDLIIEKNDNDIFIDKRNNTILDQITVNETSRVPPPQQAQQQQPQSNKTELQINTMSEVNEEATKVNESFIQQVTAPSKLHKPLPINIDKQHNLESDHFNVLYRYNQWNITNKISVIARCQVDYLLDKSNQSDERDPDDPLKGKTLLSVKTLNEYDPSISEFKQKLDAQKTSILANELKNNANKLSRWTAQALLSGVDAIKFGFVSRIKSKSNEDHCIMGTTQYSPVSFANQIGIKMNNLWGVVKLVVDAVKQYGDGKYCLMKEPNTQILVLYKVPEDETFDMDEEETIIEDQEEEEEEQNDTQDQHEQQKTNNVNEEDDSDVF